MSHWIIETTGLALLDSYWNSKPHCPVCAKKRGVGWVAFGGVGYVGVVLVSGSFGALHPHIFKSKIAFSFGQKYKASQKLIKSLNESIVFLNQEKPKTFQNNPHIYINIHKYTIQRQFLWCKQKQKNNLFT